jgi:hypothetical protein
MSFYNLIGSGNYERRNCEIDSFGGLKIDGQRIASWSLKRKISRICATQNTVGERPYSVEALGQLRVP